MYSAKRINPFDKAPRIYPVIKIFIHLDSLLKELASMKSDAYKLIRLNKFKEIQIISPPQVDNSIQSLLKDFNLIKTEYVFDQREFNIIVNNSSYLLARKSKLSWDEQMLREMIPGSKLLCADIIAAQKVADYFVVGQEIKNRLTEGYPFVITAKQALELVRVLMIGLGIFYLAPNIGPITESHYYTYRYKKLFNSYQYIWSIVVFAYAKKLIKQPPKNVTKGIDLASFIHSLGTRLNFICRAYDKIAFLSYRSPNSEALDWLLYHFSFFIMLCTGIFDDLAHIINTVYEIQDDPKKVGLRLLNERGNLVKKENNTYKFINDLKSNNEKIFDFINGEEIQNQINIFYLLRDSLQHRDMPQSALLTHEETKNVLEISDEAIIGLKKNTVASQCILFNPSNLIEPLALVTWALDFMINIVNRTITMIDWNPLINTFPSDVQAKIKESHDKFSSKSVSEFMGLGDEPWYL